MLAMSIIVIVLGAVVLVAGITLLVVHSGVRASYRKITEEEGLTWGKAEMDSAVEQIRAERAQLKAADKEGTLEWAGNTAKLANTSLLWTAFGLMCRLFPALAIVNIVLGIALILVGVSQL